MDGDAERFVVECARNGSQQAWRQLFQWHFDAMYCFCSVLTGGCRDEAEDLSQEVFVTAAGRLSRYRPDRGPFRVWLYGIARNRHLNLVAKEQRHRKYESQPHQLDRLTKTDNQPYVLVHEALARLPFQYRCVLEDKYLKQRSMKEMAQIYGRSVEAIESLLRRAREHFAPIYESIQNER